MCQMFHQSYSIILVLMIPTQKSINQHLSATPRHPIIHHQVITSMREIWSPRPPISMSSQSPATGTWAWASQWGGRKKKKLVAQSHEQFFFFSSLPLSRQGARQGHHTSPGHHLYEGDLVSKTSNLNEFSISSNWGLGLGFSMGGRKKEELVAHSHEQFFFFISPLPGRRPAGPVAGD